MVQGQRAAAEQPAHQRGGDPGERAHALGGEQRPAVTHAAFQEDRKPARNQVEVGARHRQRPLSVTSNEISAAWRASGVAAGAGGFPVRDTRSSSAIMPSGKSARSRRRGNGEGFHRRLMVRSAWQTPSIRDQRRWLGRPIRFSATVRSACRQSCGNSATISRRDGRQARQRELHRVRKLHGDDRARRQPASPKCAARPKWRGGLCEGHRSGGVPVTRILSGGSIGPRVRWRARMRRNNHHVGDAGHEARVTCAAMTRLRRAPPRFGQVSVNAVALVFVSDSTARSIARGYCTEESRRTPTSARGRARAPPRRKPALARRQQRAIMASLAGLSPPLIAVRAGRGLAPQ